MIAIEYTGKRIYTNCDKCDTIFTHYDNEQRNRFFVLNNCPLCHGDILFVLRATR